MRNVVVALAVVFTVLLLAYATYLGALGPIPPNDLRELAKALLERSYRPWNPFNTSMCPEAVTAVVWDFRGLDTVFETVVFYGAIVATLALYRTTSRSLGLVGERLSLIVRYATLVSVPMILIVAAATALHGQLTPGGGFQGGAIAAVAPVVALVVFGRRKLLDLGVTYVKALIVRNLALVAIALTALGPLIAGIVLGINAYVLQNQGKVGAPLSYPPWILDVPSGGSVILFNIFEALAVAAGFTLVFLTLALDEETARRELVGEDRGW